MTEHWRVLLTGDGCCELLGRLKEEYDVQHAEISRLRTKIVGLEAIIADNEARVANTHGMAAEIERQRARIAEIEAGAMRFSEAVFHQAMKLGTLATPTPDEPSRFTCNIPPSAPPHDE